MPIRREGLETTGGSEGLIKHRNDLLGYVVSPTRNLADAEDALSHAVEKVLRRHAEKVRGSARTGGGMPLGCVNEACSRTVIPPTITAYTYPARADRLGGDVTA